MIQPNNICRCPACAGDGGAPPAPTVSTGAGGAIPPDGFYTALVNHDTGGELRRYVRVAEKKPYTASGHILNYGACSEFKPCNTWDFVYGFPKAAAKELDVLRTEKARLEEQVERLEAWKAEVVAVEAKWDAQAIAAMLGSRLGESTRTAIQREVPLLLERVKRLEEVLADPAAVWANMLRGTIAMPTHIPELEGRLTDAHALADRFQKAGQDAIDYIDGKHRDARRVLDGWRKANK